jgi:ABC-type glycerol-3-phosphate transport system substrate-binding protein
MISFDPLYITGSYFSLYKSYKKCTINLIQPNKEDVVMKKKVLVSLIMILFLVVSFQVLFAGTSKKDDADTTKESEPAKEILITIWKGPNTDHDPQIYEDVISAFEAKHPGVNVELIPTPWGSIAEKYTTAFAAGNPADIIYSFTGGYVDGVVPMCYDLREIYTDKEFAIITKGVADSMLWEGTLPDGKLIGVPFYAAPQSFTWNGDLFAEAGFDRPPRTLDEMIEYAKALTKDLDGDGKTDQWGWGQLSFDTAEQKPEHFLYQFGATLLNETLDDIGYDNDEGLKAFEYIDRLWNVEKVAVPIGLYPGTTMYDAFFDGVFAMFQAPAQVVTFITDPNFNLKSGPMPQGPGRSLADGRGTYVGSGMWSIAEATKNLDLVKEFVLMLYDPKYSVPIALETGFFPVNTTVTYDIDPINKGFFEAMKYGVPYRFSPHIQEVKEAVWHAMEALQAGAIGPEEAWEQAVDNGRAAFE